MIWWHATTSEQLQAAYSGLRRTSFGRRLAPVWSQMALHRPAEFNRSHLPAFLSADPKKHVAVYPFVLSSEWCLLADAERRRPLAYPRWIARDHPPVPAQIGKGYSGG